MQVLASELVICTGQACSPSSETSRRQPTRRRHTSGWGQWRRAPRTCRTGSKRARRGTARPAMCGSCASGLGLLRERRLPEVRNDLSVKATPSELLPIPLMGFEGGGSRAQLRKALPR